MLRMRDACVARRERTNTPTQALLLLNESEYLKAARQLARLTLDQPAPQRLDFVWETVTARLPDEQEKEVLHDLLVDLTEKYTANPALASELCQGVEMSASGSSNEASMSQAQAELAAWTVVGNVLYNLDITKTKD